MNVFNAFLMSLSPAVHHVLYFLMHGIAFLLAILYVVFHGQRYHLSRDMTIVLVMIIGIMGASVQILFWIYQIILDVKFRNLAHTFLLLGPLTAWQSYLTKTPARRNLDIMGPMFLIAKGVSGLGCLFWGCCAGAEVPWGIYSYQRDCLVAPIQILEFAGTTLLVFLLNYYEKRHEYNGSGHVFGLSLIGYGLIRFFSDLLKVGGKLFWLVSSNGVFALLFIASGIVTLVMCRTAKPQAKLAL